MTDIDQNIQDTKEPYNKEKDWRIKNLRAQYRTLREVCWGDEEDVAQTYAPLLQTRDHYFHLKWYVMCLQEELCQKLDSFPEDEAVDDETRKFMHKVLDAKKDLAGAENAYMKAKEAYKKAKAIHHFNMSQLDSLKKEMQDIEEYDEDEEDLARDLWLEWEAACREHATYTKVHEKANVTYFTYEKDRNEQGWWLRPTKKKIEDAKDRMNIALKDRQKSWNVMEETKGNYIKNIYRKPGETHDR